MVDAVCRAIYHSQGGRTLYAAGRKMSPWTNYFYNYLYILIKNTLQVQFKTLNSMDLFHAC